MEIRSFAEGVLTATNLAKKLEPPPPDLSDAEPGDGLAPEGPVRPPGLEILPGRAVRVPPASGLADPAQRSRILHAFVNHELQAAELFSWALLRFPKSPPAFRRGLLRLVADEQSHARLYCERLEELGVSFGDLPVSGHFWRQRPLFGTALKFVVRMGLVFESANLDLGLEHLAVAERCGDLETSRILKIVHRDEVQHVAFAWTWFRAFKDQSQNDWDAYAEALGDPAVAARARGKLFDREGRLRAGVAPEFLDRLESIAPRTPGGHAR